MGAVETTYTFSSTDTITSTKLNNIIDDTVITSTAILGTTLEVASGKLKVRSSGITSNELSSNSVTTNSITDGSVTQAKTSNMLVPAGAIMPFAMNGAPTGWLSADGSTVSRTTYDTLFGLIGTTYGSGDGSTTFTLPDLQGYFVRGFGTSAGSGAFGAKQDDAFKAHTHTAIQTLDSNGGLDLGSGRLRYGASGNTGSTGSTETRPKNIAMLYCIKY